jgi:hypothetical protein
VDSVSIINIHCAAPIMDVNRMHFNHPRSGSHPTSDHGSKSKAGEASEFIFDDFLNRPTRPRMMNGTEAMESFVFAISGVLSIMHAHLRLGKAFLPSVDDLCARVSRSPFRQRFRRVHDKG